MHIPSLLSSLPAGSVVHENKSDTDAFTLALLSAYSSTEVLFGNVTWRLERWVGLTNPGCCYECYEDQYQGYRG